MIMAGNDLLKAIKKTVSYAGGYGQTLTIGQLERRLISPRIWKFKDVRKMVLTKNIPINRGDGQNSEAKRKITLARQVFENKFMDKLPLVMVAVTGSVAAGNPDKNDDIDLLLVTKINRMWWTRLCLLGWLHWKGIGVRKAGNKEREDDFCPNLWLEEDSLEIPKSRQTLQSATDMMNMVVIRGRDEIKGMMAENNGWVKYFLATGEAKMIRKLPRMTKRVNSENRVIDWLNHIAFVWQYRRMEKKITKEIVNKHQAFYHPGRI